MSKKLKNGNLSNVPDDQLSQIVGEEIKKAKYLKEDWQIHYAKERIIKAIKPPENICPFCGAEGKKISA